MKKSTINCSGCGQEFKNNYFLERHTKGLRTCVKMDLTKDQLNDPNRCIYCNRISATKFNLDRHLTNCKVKKFQNEKKHKQTSGDEIKSLKKQIKEQQKQVDKHLKHMKKQQKQIDKLLTRNVSTTNQTAHIINNNNDNSTHIDQSKNVYVNYNQIYTAAGIKPPSETQLNSYLTPNLNGIRFNLDEIAECDDFYKLSVNKTYFNKEHPENHSIYVPNVKMNDLMVYDGENWIRLTGDLASKAKIHCGKKSYDVGYVCTTEIENKFKVIPIGTQTVLWEHNTRPPKSGDELVQSITEIATTNRNLVVGNNKIIM